MKIYNEQVELIVSTTNIGAKFKRSFNMEQQLERGGIPVRKVSSSRRKKVPSSKALGAGLTQKTYVKTLIRDSEENPWDVAHRANRAIATHPFVEPDLFHEYVADSNADVPFKKRKGRPGHQNPLGYDPDWQPHVNKVWHLGEDYSQLGKARSRIKDTTTFNVRIGHLDTGIDKGHVVLPKRITKHRLQRNFIEGEPSNNAEDRMVSGTLRNPGHGLATLALLAGGKVKIENGSGKFEDELGGAPFAEVIPCRIASSVVLIKTSAFAEALNYLTDLTLSGTPVHVVSMSMGGAPAQSWADAVNRAYDAGITVVTAAGNNFNGLPTRHMVYPARFGRVIAACGVTYDGRPYKINKIGEMQGCYGPDRYMSTAIAAFTPNTPWAKAGTKKQISFSGAGTSSATPQVAAAAAIYYRFHHKQLDDLEYPWQRVEAIRRALFRSARKNSIKDYKSYFGNGVIQANSALDIPVGNQFKETPADEIPFFPILTTIFKTSAQKNVVTLQMLNTELAQLMFNYPELENMKGADFSKANKKQLIQLAEAVIEHHASSIALKEHLIHATGGKRATLGSNVVQKRSVKKRGQTSKKK